MSEQNQEAITTANLPVLKCRQCGKLRGVVIENKPAAQVIDVHDTRALDIMHGDHGYAHEMTDDQHRELAQVIHGVRGMVVLSGYHGDLYDEIYADWQTVECEALADGAARRREVLWFNEAAASRMNEQMLF
jgi:DNA adenine methylase